MIIRAAHCCFDRLWLCNGIPDVGGLTVHGSRVLTWCLYMWRCPVTNAEESGGVACYCDCGLSVARHWVWQLACVARHLIWQCHYMAFAFSALTLLVVRQEGHPACKKWGDGGGGHCLVRMEWRPAWWSVCLPLLIFPCTIKSRSSLLAPAHPEKGPKTSVVVWCHYMACHSLWQFSCVACHEVWNVLAWHISHCESLSMI